MTRTLVKSTSEYNYCQSFEVIMSYNNQILSTPLMEYWHFYVWTTYVLCLVSHIYLAPHRVAPHRGRARYCNAHVCLFVCVFVTSPLAPIGGGRGIVMPMSVCLSVCLFVRVFAKFQSVISQPFLNRSLWNLAYILRMGTPWLTNIFRILGQRSRS